MNLLSIGASYGVIVAVLQWGWGSSLLGVHDSIPVSPFVPMIMFAILFGLSMDYEVFLLSRIREQFLRTRRQPAQRGRGPVEHRTGDHQLGAHHDQRLRRLHAEPRPHPQDVRPRADDGDHHRRHPRPHGARAGHHEPARLGQLVAARAGSTSACRPSTSKATTKTPPRRSRSSSCRSQPSRSRRRRRSVSS